MSENIYAPPKASIKPDTDSSISENDVQEAIAPTGRRFLNNIIDTVFIYILSFVLGLILGVISLFIETNENIIDILAQTGSIMITLLYYILFEYFTGRTAAKYITGTKVIAQSGTKPTFGQVLGRTASRFIPFDAFSFLGGAGFPVGWHDRISQTRVVLISDLNKNSEEEEKKTET